MTRCCRYHRVLRRYMELERKLGREVAFVGVTATQCFQARALAWFRRCGVSVDS